MPQTATNKDEKSISTEMERRTMAVAEIRAEPSDDGPRRVSGYAAKFNTEIVYGWFREIIRPGAFKASLSDGSDIRALFNHNSDLVLGRSSAGTLRLKEDDIGLWFEADLPDTNAGRDLYTSIGRGDISGASFGFMVRAENWHYEDGEQDLRELLDVELVEVSVVTFPAYDDTAVAVRSKERFDAECGRSQAKASENAKRDVWLLEKSLDLPETQD